MIEVEESTIIVLQCDILFYTLLVNFIAVVILHVTFLS